jgi:adenylate cyclase
LAAHMPATEMVRLLNDIFSVIDVLVDRHGLEKVKTSGDAYMVVGGLPIPREDHLRAMADMALDVIETNARFSRPDGTPCQVRIGIHSGPVVAGVIGTKKFIYDLWGDTVNIASRMESQGIPGAIQVTQLVHDRLQTCFQFEPRGELPVKGKGAMMTYLLVGKK